MRSPALVADGRHLMTDVVTSVGVIVGPAARPAHRLGLARFGAGGFRRAQHHLVGLDADEGEHRRPDGRGPAGGDACSRVREIIAINAEGAIEAHDLRTRHAGRLTFIDFHLVVPGGMSVTQAHDICDRLERALKADIGERSSRSTWSPTTRPSTRASWFYNACPSCADAPGMAFQCL